MESQQNDNRNSLPATDLLDDGNVSLLRLPRPALGFANAHLASNPQEGYNTNVVGLFLKVKL